MLFNSWNFIVFLLVVLLLDALLQHRPQPRKWMLLLASYVFYGAWDVTFLALIIGSTLIDFEIARRLPRSTHPRRVLLLSLLINLGMLAFFKYANFLINALNYGLAFAHSQLQFSPLDIVLPVGISFFTFQALSYTIDIYRGDIAPRQSRLDYALFIAFFPQLVAGPIVRAREFFNELDRPTPPNSYEINLGLVLIVLGLLKKMAVADSLAGFVDPIFATPEFATAAQVLLGTYAYALQIYCDFSGYTDVAIGTALLFGFRFPQNFNYPYMALSFQDFWRRWHMTLSRFLRDYLYVSLGGNRHSLSRTQINVLLTMLLGGLWHGAAWTFVFWGFLHGSLLVLERGAMALFPAFYRSKNPAILVLRWLLVFHGVCLAWIFFRAPSFAHAEQMLIKLGQIFTPSFATEALTAGRHHLDVIAVLGLFAGLHALGARGVDNKRRIAAMPNWLCALVLGVALCLIAAFTPPDARAFIYFQF